MRVLVIKTSSLGDVIHTLPAVTDAGHAFPGIKFDWLVEEAFSEVPGWHSSVDRVLPVAWRRWRKRIWHPEVIKEYRQLRGRLRAMNYDMVIDAQGLMKSAVLGCLVPAPVAGMTWATVREPMASLTYRHRFEIGRQQHAVERSRQLFAQALNYPNPVESADYGLASVSFRQPSDCYREKSVVLVHASARADKLWPVSYWRQLCLQLSAKGFSLQLPWGTQQERVRAEEIARSLENVFVLSKTSLSDLAARLAAACCVVAVDTGVGHLAAALGRPTISLYGPTDPKLIGAYGLGQYHLCADVSTGDTYQGKSADSLENIFPETVVEAVLGATRRCAA
ncbi:MAG: lipopolysaccharide heptosyltransferase I [Pirellulaceae bacterium]|nr:lipopolysaccharide heptosyltransferase I [Pirellulaceae bacterium]